MSDDVTQAREAVDATYRLESCRIFATLVRLLGDFDIAEEALHDAFRAALEQWPRDGVPANPRAWLVSTGRFKAIERDSAQRSLRRAGRRRRTDGPCHRRRPAGGPRGHRGRPPAADLHLVSSGLGARRAGRADAAGDVRPHHRRIAHDFLTAGPTVAQRIVRAKTKIRDARIPYQVPSGDELAQRLDAVLRVVYLVFNEG